jgi:hypothetical protein
MTSRNLVEGTKQEYNEIMTRFKTSRYSANFWRRWIFLNSFKPVQRIKIIEKPIITTREKQQQAHMT